MIRKELKRIEKCGSILCFLSDSEQCGADVRLEESNVWTELCGRQVNAGQLSCCRLRASGQNVE